MNGAGGGEGKILPRIREEMPRDGHVAGTLGKLSKALCGRREGGRKA